MKRLIITLLLMATGFGNTFSAIITPYPDTLIIKQINSAEKERLRLAQGHKKCDRQPTGFYVEQGKTIVLTVETLHPAADAQKPVLTVGTPGFNIDGRTYSDYPLNEGINTIAAANAGLIYFSFITNVASEPVGEVKITFTAESEQVRAPQYVFGVTTDAEFCEMMDTYKVPDVLYYSDYAIITATYDKAKINSYNNDKNEWLSQIHRLLELEDEISGLDNNDPNPLHHRLHAGEIRQALTNNTSASPHANSSGYTAYPNTDTYARRYLTVFSANNNSWLEGHEIGHQHQQPAYQINQATESTVNIYSYVVERYFQTQTDVYGSRASVYNRTSEQRWQQAQNTYLALPVADRVYDMADATLEGITGFNRDELRFMVWEQLFLIFGDDFYKTLHRITREEKVTSGSSEERSAYLIWKSSQITGYDLREFFNQWGIRVNDEELKDVLDKRIDYALTEGTIEVLPYAVSELIMATGQNRPAWAPLPLKGIKTSQPALNYADRTDWTVTTSIQGVPDAVIEGVNPQNIVDNDLTSAFSFIKPGKTYEGVTGPADYSPSFIIDMKKDTEFNFVIYRHRTANNNSEYIRARNISAYVSDNGVDFTPFAENFAIDPVANKDEIKIAVDDNVKHRYLKIVINDWNRSSGSTIQVSEVYVGVETKDNYQTINEIVSDDFIEENDVIISPNPVLNGQPFIVFLSDNKVLTGAKINIFALSGLKIYDGLLPSSQQVVINASPGIYIVVIEADTKRYVKRIVVGTK